METALQPQLRKFSVAEYYRLAETGVLRPSERVELLNGQIIRMAPRGEKHRTIVDKLTYIFVDKPGKRYQVSVPERGDTRGKLIRKESSLRKRSRM